MSTWYTFAVSIFLLAVLFGIARLLLPYTSEYKADISAVLSEYLGQPVRVHNLDTEWHGWGPALVFENIALLDARSEKPVLQFPKARVGFNLVTSLFQWQPVLSGIALVGVDLELSREKDGRFSIAGIAGGGSGSDMAAVMAWLMSQQKLGLEDSDITWHDKMGAGREMHFSAVNVSLRNSGDRHLLDASVVLPESLGRSLGMHIDIRGDALNAGGRRTQAYFIGEEVNLAGLLGEQSLAGVSVVVSEADFQVWSQWQDGKLQSMRGDVDISDIVLIALGLGGGEKNEQVKSALIDSSPTDKGKPDTMQLKQFAGKFHWQQSENQGWHFDSSDVVLALNDRKWLPSRISVDVGQGEGGQASLEVAASYLQLEDAAHLLRLFNVGGERLRTPLLAVAPRGQLFDAGLSWQGGDTPAYSAYARLDRASVNAWKLVPDANNVYGQLWMDTHGGQAILEHAAMTLDFPNLFRWPLKIDELRGQVGWEIEGDKWQLTGRDLVANNEDIRFKAELDIVNENTDLAPFIFMAAKFEDGDVSQVAHYLPTGVMADSAVNWLDTAIVDGRIASGGAIMHGRLSEFPFDKGNGKFEVRLGIEEARLDYAKGWPLISDMNAEIQFLGRGMSVNAQHGKIYSNEIQWANVTLPDMTVKPLQILINGDIKGATQEKLDYLVASPRLYKSFGKYLEGMIAEGDSLLHLELELPINKDENDSVQGWVDMENNSLSIPPLGRVLGDMGGRLNFSQKGLGSDEIHAELFSQTTTLKISTTEDTGAENNNWTSVQAEGLFDAKDTASFYFPSIKELLKGDGEWGVLFKIPVGSQGDAPRTASLRATVDFKNVEMALPSPFNKQSGDVATMELNVDFQPGHAPIVRAAYGGLINGIFELGNGPNEELSEKSVAGIQRGELRLGGGPVSFPEGNGLRVVGWLDSVSLDDWLELWPDNDMPSADQSITPSFLHSADVAIRNLEAYGQQFHNARLRTGAKPAKNAWRFDVDSDELAGQIEIPSNLVVDPVRANLKHAYLVEPQLAAGSVDPRDIPALNVQVEDLRYESRKFGSLKLETTKMVNGLRIEQLVLRPKSTTIITRGGWYIGGGAQNSTVLIDVETSDAGRTLKELGYVGGVDGGEGEISLELRWPSAFFDVDVNQVQGRLEMFLRNGQLLDIDPGAGGRLFGMLSLQTLPRRLFLDFSDVFAKGFGFDRIKGIFNIKDGDAYTNNLYLDGPAARIEITGRTGLAQQDYDQLVTVTPKVGESLPLLGMLAATPQVGAVILFVQKLFKPGIDEATKNQYTITGNWDDPQIKKVKSSKTAAQSEEEQPVAVE